MRELIVGPFRIEGGDWKSQNCEEYFVIISLFNIVAVAYLF